MHQIPKRLHFCWFGNGKYPLYIEKCMESWHRILPEYIITKWSEDNFDLEKNIFISEAYKRKQWAFITDYVRLYVLYNYGGIYLDTDVEILKPMDEFLDNEAFSGFESKDSIPTAVMGSRKGNRVIKQLMDYYEGRHFILEDGRDDITTNVRIITDHFLHKGFVPNGRMQVIDGFAFYPQRYFCPNSIMQVLGKKPFGSYTIHHSGGGFGWFVDNHKPSSAEKKEDTNNSRKCKIKRYAVNKLRNCIGTKNTLKLRKKLHFS